MLELDAHDALLVDLYELTMAAAYFEHQVDCRATFELFVRQLPPERAFLVAGGIEDALDYLAELRFREEDVGFLRSLPLFRNVSSEFFEYLRQFRFDGDVEAVEEGALIFSEEPLLQVTAPILAAQIVETYLLSVINFETLVASKAARVVRAARGRGVLEFGTRRAQGPEAGVRAARAAYLGGCLATSNVLAGFRYGIPLAGTAAHSWTQAFPTERQSFVALLDTFSEDAILLIDTYDPLVGAETAATLGRKIAGVRIDSGDLLEKSCRVREILDRHGLREAKIVASGDLNEYKVEALLSQGAPIDLFGVGTDLATSRDVPALSVVYKLVETERNGRVEHKSKFSEEKVYWPGRKQIFRFSEGAQYHHDVIARSSENFSGGAPLLRPVMRHGHRLRPRARLQDSRTNALANLELLPEPYHALRDAPAYPVAKSEALQRLLEEVHEQAFENQKLEIRNQKMETGR
ncbi:MAG TPA: nicotinate phosphoribosyltransferase [Candidatus Sulfotelmatobacter sp.]|nr:nicotinate phosphoribosyltransferase [Candidatus Sulfotelmatobacter sp.]